MYYSTEEREAEYQEMLKFLKEDRDVIGIVQIGSGVSGYNDVFSDIDLMVVVNSIDSVDGVRNHIMQYFEGENLLYSKTFAFTEHILMTINMLNHFLEFNISVMTVKDISMKSKMIRCIYEETGEVSRKIAALSEAYEKKESLDQMWVDTFVYYSLTLFREFERENYIYINHILEDLRYYTRTIQVENEGKKLHQFKAFNTLDETFIKKYLDTYTENQNKEGLIKSFNKIKLLFIEVVGNSETLSLGEVLRSALLKTEY
ncbi:hypothetical protein [Corticicoccus populi]|uniref:Polymerase nucleotidyl transferase domain-containing protein n=1 Tax=Corticicoccus populi TaxID=1812821 RepID=A0ABW5WXE2_9STAP